MSQPQRPVTVPVAEGSGLREAIEVMDRLRGPGGCPWDAEQSHVSLTPYLAEEAFEAIEALESGDRSHMREELGDVLLQVLFHARIAQEHPDEPFDIDDVARGLVAKLTRRHPHVFADTEVSGAGEVSVNWEAIKAEEKAERAQQAAPGASPDGPLAGIPAGMPPLERAMKVCGRLTRTPLGQGALDRHTQGGEPGEQETGRALLALVAQARESGVEPATALRTVLRELEADLHASA